MKIHYIRKSTSVAKPAALRVGVDLMFRIVDKFNSVAGIEKKRYQFKIALSKTSYISFSIPSL